MLLRLVLRSRLLAGLILAALGSGLAGCSTPVSLGNVFSSDDSPGQKVTPGSIAFEPVVGLPDALATQLAAELGTAAVGQRLTVVGRDDPKAALRAKGYFTATTELSQTRITYVWDLFDASGQRKQRFEGQQVVGRVANDPWSVVDQELLATIAEETITRMAGSGRSAAAPQASVPDANMLALQAPGPADPLPMRSEHPKFTVGKATASAGDGSRVIPAAMGAALAQAGVDIAGDTAQATHVISAEATVAPDSGGMDKVTLIWTLADTAGHRLGRVKQEKHVPHGALASTWAGHVEAAAEAAAPGLVALALQN